MWLRAPRLASIKGLLQPSESSALTWLIKEDCSFYKRGDAQIKFYITWHTAFSESWCLLSFQLPSRLREEETFGFVCILKQVETSKLNLPRHLEDDIIWHESAWLAGQSIQLALTAQESLVNWQISEAHCATAYMWCIPWYSLSFYTQKSYFIVHIIWTTWGLRKEARRQEWWWPDSPTGSHWSNDPGCRSTQGKLLKWHSLLGGAELCLKTGPEVLQWKQLDTEWF